MKKLTRIGKENRKVLVILSESISTAVLLLFVITMILALVYKMPLTSTIEIPFYLFLVFSGITGIVLTYKSIKNELKRNENTNAS